MTSKYTYDHNGNVISDTRDSIAFAIYEINNLPVSQYKKNGTVIQYAYDVNGSRVQKYASGGTNTYYINDPTGKTETVQTGTANSVYTYNIWGNDMLGQVKDNAGSLSRYYYLKDHLGDIKMVLNQSGGVDSYNDYYPFGMQMPGRNLTGTADGRYKFTSKEQNVETTLDYGVYPALGGSARYYDNWRGQWLSVDPLYQGFSPYEYCTDDPTAMVDPNGKYSYYVDGMPVSEETAESLSESGAATDTKGQQERENEQRKKTDQKTQNAITTMTNLADAASASLAVVGTGFGGVALLDPELVSKTAFAAISADAFLWSGITGLGADAGSLLLAWKYNHGDLNKASMRLATDAILTLSGEIVAKKLERGAEFTRWGARSTRTGRWVTTAAANRVQAAEQTVGCATFFMSEMLGASENAGPANFSNRLVNAQIDMTSTVINVK